MENNIKKNVLLIITVLLVGLGLAGGTYAWFSNAVSVTNGNYATDTHCFDVSYTDNTDQITGTMFPSSNAGGGLSGSISFKRSTSCATNGRGTFYLHVDSNTSTILTSTVAAHCENKYTLETIGEFNSSDCANNPDNAVWVTNGTALKYAIYDSTARNHLYAAGYIDSSFIGQDKAIHTDFSINNTQKTYYLYIWLDGYVSDNTYTDLPFSATSKLMAMQTKSNDTTFIGDSYTTIDNTIYQYNGESPYQRVEFLQSDGTQYIDTGLTGHMNYKYELTFQQTDSSSTAIWGVLDTTSWQGPNMSLTWNNGRAVRWDYQNNEKRLIDRIDTINQQKHNIIIDNGNITYDNQAKGRSSGHNDNFIIDKNIYLFTLNPGNSTPGSIFTGRIFLYKVWDNYGELIQNFVPVYRKSDSKPGLYDIVNGEFYTNEATSGNDFTVGPDI